MLSLHVLLVFILTITQCHGQAGSRTGPLNSWDSLGRKHGLWIEDNGLKEIYYSNGLRLGLYKSYYKKTNKLESFGEYKLDKPTGIWYYFDENSYLILVESQIARNNKLRIKRDDGEFITPSDKSYVKVYGKNGNVLREGLALYDGDIQTEYFMFGVWKYYGENGALVKEENYREGRIAP